MSEVVSVADIYSKAEQVFNDKFNNKKFTTSNVSWDGRTTTLRDVLGDLLNYPGGVETLRDWIERTESKISTLESKIAMLEDSPNAVSIVNNIL